MGIPNERDMRPIRPSVTPNGESVSVRGRGGVQDAERLLGSMEAKEAWSFFDGDGPIEMRIWSTWGELLVHNSQHLEGLGRVGHGPG